jgi:hypothetical protein
MDAAGLEIEMEALAADGAGAAFQLTFPRSRYTDHWLYKQWFAEPWSGARETEVLNGVSSFKNCLHTFCKSHLLRELVFLFVPVR